MTLRRKSVSVGVLGLGALLLLIQPWSWSQEREIASAATPTVAFRAPAEVAIETPVVEAHPLTSALELAYEKLAYIRENVRDYTCMMVKRERIQDELLPVEYVRVKCRQRKLEGEAVSEPLSVYLKYFEPKAYKGREVLFVEGRDHGKMLVRKGGGRSGFMKVWLDPNGAMAMQTNRYPITEMAMDNLVMRLIDVGENDLQYDECEVNLIPGSTMNGRECLGIEVIHPEERDHFQFHIARIYLDDELQVPIHFELFLWPSEPGGEPRLLEMYSFRDLQINVGLQDSDFERSNPEYGF